MPGPKQKNPAERKYGRRLPPLRILHRLAEMGSKSGQPISHFGFRKLAPLKSKGKPDSELMIDGQRVVFVLPAVGSGQVPGSPVLFAKSHSGASVPSAHASGHTGFVPLANADRLPPVQLRGHSLAAATEISVKGQLNLFHADIQKAVELYQDQAQELSIEPWLTTQMSLDELCRQLNFVNEYITANREAILEKLLAQECVRVSRTTDGTSSPPRSWSIHYSVNPSRVFIVVNLKSKKAETLEKDATLVSKGGFKSCKPAAMFHFDSPGIASSLKCQKMASLVPLLQKGAEEKNTKKYGEAEREVESYIQSAHVPGLVKPITIHYYTSYKKAHQTVEMIFPFGEDLQKYAYRHFYRRRMLPDYANLEWCARSICVVLSSLATQEPPLVHGDIKPDNMLLLPPNSYLALSDLSSMTQQGDPKSSLAGTYMYYSPETILALSVLLNRWIGLPSALKEKFPVERLSALRDHFRQSPEVLDFLDTTVGTSAIEIAYRVENKFIELKGCCPAFYALAAQLDAYIEHIQAPDNFMKALSPQLSHDWWAAGITLLSFASNKDIRLLTDTTGGAAAPEVATPAITGEPWWQPALPSDAEPLPGIFESALTSWLAVPSERLQPSLLLEKADSAPDSLPAGAATAPTEASTLVANSGAGGPRDSALPRPLRL